jgi:hypothetical protein
MQQRKNRGKPNLFGGIIIGQNVASAHPSSQLLLDSAVKHKKFKVP